MGVLVKRQDRDDNNKRRAPEIGRVTSLVPGRVNTDGIMFPSVILRCKFSRADGRFKRHHSNTYSQVCRLLSLDC